MSVFVPWLEALGAGALAFSAFFLGRQFSRFPGKYWLIGYVIPLFLILLFSVALFEPRVAMAPPITWMVGRSRFVCFGFAAIMMLSALLARLPKKQTRVVLCLLALVIGCVSVLPFAGPVINRADLAALQTRVDADGICRQSNEYTCGPAAAVTVLRKLGLNAEEGEIAILARSCAMVGTDPDVLARALQKRYGGEGIVVEYRSFNKAEELKSSGLTIAVVAFNAMQDHCVAILGMEANQVRIGDPLSGLSLMPVEEFEKNWQFVGIVVRRGPR
ncbi:MAG TPA: cysteine peptidase family C39 domain-containing protein [Clostridia bacterium]|nr:cysteine peptidase family C39 domain-containing protein [Clostridia bacterium]